jgi:hypothetical protein
METATAGLRETLAAFRARFLFRAPECFADPSPDDCGDFRRLALKLGGAWYPLKSPPSLEDIQAIYVATEEHEPILTKTVMSTLLLDLITQENDIYEGDIVPLEVIAFFREKGIPHCTFYYEKFPPPAAAAPTLPAATVPLPPSPPLPPLRVALPPLTPAEESLCRLHSGLSIPHYYWLKTTLNAMKAQAEAEGDEARRAEFALDIASIEAHLAAAERR